MPSPSFLKQVQAETKIDASARATLVDWVVNVHRKVSSSCDSQALVSFSPCRAPLAVQADETGVGTLRQHSGPLPEPETD